MLKIAHRGNYLGVSDLENDPDYVWAALSMGYDVEVDIWYVCGLWLGHDSPQYKIDFSFFNERMWLHCKNKEAYNLLSKFKSLNAFMHNDGIALTTKGYLWVAPGLEIMNRSIAVMPELAEEWDISNAFGICSDYL